MWGPVAETLIFTFFSLCGDPVVEDFEFSRKNPYRVLCPVVETLIFLKKNPVGKNVSTGDFEFFRSKLPGVGSEIAK